MVETNIIFKEHLQVFVQDMHEDLLALQDYFSHILVLVELTVTVKTVHGI